MKDKNASNKKASWLTALFIVIGALLSFGGTAVTELYLIPSKEVRMKRNEQKEYKLTRLYQPLLVVTGYGDLSMTSPGVFVKVQKIMEEYGYLADKELTEKYIDFLKLCSFASYSDLKRGDMFGPLPENIILEIIRQDKVVLQWNADSLRKAIDVQKEFHAILAKVYKKALEDFIEM